MWVDLSLKGAEFRLRDESLHFRAPNALNLLTRHSREAFERGFAALKSNALVFDARGGGQYTPGSARGNGHPELNLPEEIVEALIAQLTALRKGAGAQMRLIVDLNFNYKPEGFRRLAKKLEPFDLMWLEMYLYEPKALSLIWQSTTTPIGSLETMVARSVVLPPAPPVAPGPPGNGP